MLREVARSTAKMIGLKPGWQFRFMPYRALATDRATVNSEYASGHWSALANEMPRYSVIAGLCRQANPEASILDVGCGDGLLAATLHSYSYYLGVDLSDEAIRQASEKSNGQTGFAQSAAEAFVPDRKFDIVVFNECLFYFDKPAELVKRYEPFLEPNGAFIVSMYEMGLDRLIWKSLDSRYLSLRRIRLVTDASTSWTIGLLSSARN